MTHNPFAAARAKLQALVKPAAGKVPAPPAPAPASTPPPPPTPAPQETDEALFLREMGGVKRLAGSRRAPQEKADVPARPRPSEDAEVVAELADLVQGTGVWDIADTDEYIEGIGPGLDRRLLTRLRKGEYAVQGHVDLHGLTAEEARIRVEAFLHEARLRGWRCVLIVHGRGLNSKDQIPVLKERVRVWLTKGRISRSVLCFATARPVDGGAGAVYVLLRK